MLIELNKNPILDQTERYSAAGLSLEFIREMEKVVAAKKEPVPFQHLGQQPTFNGGNANEFSKWVAANMKYPEKCRQSKVQGRVTLQFIISATGEVTDVKVLRGVNEDLDKEALRVVSASPRWTPGKDKNGNIVPVIFTFPVLFQL